MANFTRLTCDVVMKICHASPERSTTRDVCLLLLLRCATSNHPDTGRLSTSTASLRKECPDDEEKRHVPNLPKRPGFATSDYTAETTIDRPATMHEGVLASTQLPANTLRPLPTKPACAAVLHADSKCRTSAMSGSSAVAQRSMLRRMASSSGGAEPHPETLLTESSTG